MLGLFDYRIACLYEADNYIDQLNARTGTSDNIKEPRGYMGFACLLPYKAESDMDTSLKHSWLSINVSPNRHILTTDTVCELIAAQVGHFVILGVHLTG